MQYSTTIRTTFYSIILLCTTQFVGFAQENSPYSRYGIGALSAQENLIHVGMGGVSVADNNNTIVNTTNPACNASLRLTSLNFAMQGTSTNVKTATVSAKTGASYFKYINIGMPINKNAGISFGLTPISTGRFRMTEVVQINNVSSAINSYYGGGGIQKVFFGAGYKYKDFSFGLQSGYMFGSLQRGTDQSFEDSLKTLNTNFASRTRLGGTFLQTGIHYSHLLKDSIKSINIGVSYTLPQSLTTQLDDYTITSLSDLDNNLYSDTVTSNVNFKGKVKLPSDLRIGAIFKEGEHWQVGIEYRTSPWSNYTYYGVKDNNTANMSSFHIGGSITPDVNAVTSTFKKMTYRIGAYTGTDYLTFNNTQLKKQSLSAGFSYPIRRTNFSMGQINSSLEIGKRGTTSNGLVSESFTRFCIGVSFNDKWFIKRKYD